MRVLPKRHRRNLAWAGISLLVGLARVLPRRFALALFGGAGRLFFRLGLDRTGRDRTLRNLAAVFGGTMSEAERRRLGENVYATLARSAADVVRMPRMSGGEMDTLVDARGFDTIRAAYEKGRGVICVTGHIGNWELMGAYCVHMGYPVSVLARTLYDRRLDSLLVGIRESAGIENIPRDASPRRFVSALRRGRILGILMDQDTKVSGVFADFLGRPAYTPLGPASLALATGAPVVPMAAFWSEGGRYIVEVRDAIEVERTGDRDADLMLITERLNSELGSFILSHPEQWVWMHDRWKRQPK